MSTLHAGDEDLHHCDGSHRWAGGPQGVPLERWQGWIRDHMRQHLATEEPGPVRQAPDVPAAGWPVHPKHQGPGGRFKVSSW